jgi:hypothetical protein
MCVFPNTVNVLWSELPPALAQEEMHAVERFIVARFLTWQFDNSIPDRQV